MHDLPYGLGLIRTSKTKRCACGCSSFVYERRRLKMSQGRWKWDPAKYLPECRKRMKREREAVRLDNYEIDRLTGCWNWQGARGKHGYGLTTFDQKTEIVHRLTYAKAKGPIPAGLHIDHLCRNRQCVNPDHLEAVTQAENNRRAAAANRRSVV